MNVREKYSKVMNQCFDTAIIIDSSGIKRGSIIIRYTKGTYRNNIEASVIFYHNDIEIDCDNDTKGDSYHNSALFEILSKKGARCFDYYGEEFFNDYKQKDGMQISSTSRMDEIKSFKIKNRIYKILWV